MTVNENFLSLSYEEDEKKYDRDTFFSKFGNEKFNSDSKQQMLIMIEEVTKELNLTDEYSIKRLEIALKHELPFFAVTRKLVKNWILQNFIY